MQQTFLIRKFVLTDLEPVMRINRRCLPENYSPAFFMEHHKEHPEAFLVVEADGSIVGYVMCRIEFGSSYARRLGLSRRGHIISIAVIPEYRRRGIGKELMVKAMEAMSNIYNASEYYLEVRVSNQPAISLYKKLGYKVVQRIPGYYLNGEDAFIMSREA